VQLVRVVASDCSFCYKGRLKSDGEGSGEEEEEKEAERAKRLGTQKPHRTAGVDAICICKILLGPISKSKQQEFPQLCFFFGFHGPWKREISRLFGHKAVLPIIFALMVVQIVLFYFA